MAKSKRANATRSNSAASARTNSSPEGRRSSSESKGAAAALQTFSNETIGHVAGQVWQLLDSQGAQSLPAIKKAVSAPDDVVLAAIGWLAREDKLNFSKSGRTLTISLR
jgi:Winged helix-turn-helix domain (DUF2582)